MDVDLVQVGFCIGFKNGSIRLEAIPSVYYPGQTVIGSVIFDLKEPHYFHALYINYSGQAKVFWSETEVETVHGQERERVVEYKANEEYFNITETLAGGIGITTLPGTYQTFPFKFVVPFNIPSSFENEKGNVTYTITATMVYEDMTKEEIKKDFKVVAPLDLNTGNPSLKDPIDLEFEEEYSCSCFCSADPVTIRIRLPVTGYCPGQAIPVSVEISNDSSVEITKMIFEILTRQLYRSTHPPSEYILPEEVLATQKRGAVMAHSKRNFTCDIVVPVMIAPNLEKCSIIDVGYFFRITIKLSGCNDELQDESEICLGLVPIKETLTAPYIHPMSPSLPSGPIPVENAQPNLIVPPVAAPGFTGSTNNLNRSQPNLAQNFSNQNNPPPYPGNNALYPNDNRGERFGSNVSIHKSQTNISQNASYLDNPPPYPGYAPYSSQNTAQNTTQTPYQIGFTVVGSSPYPGAVPPGGYPPYPAVGPPGQAGFKPSAPPPTD